MPDYLAQLKDLAAKSVNEDVLDAINVEYGGKVNLNQSSIGIVGFGDQVAMGEALAKQTGRPAPDFPTAPQMAIVLTPTRILCWSRGGFSGKPKAFLGEVPLSAIGGVEQEQTRVYDILTVTMRSGWEIRLESQIGHGADGFGATLVTHIPNSDH